MKKVILTFTCLVFSLAFSAQTKKAAFVSLYNSVEEIKDDDEKAAAEWFVEEYNGDFIPVAKIEDGKLKLSDYSVLWICMEDEPVVPEAFKKNKVVSAIKKYYTSGGNLFLSRYACLYLKDLERTTILPRRIDRKVNKPTGQHALSAYIGKYSEYDRSNHPIYANLITSDQFLYPTFPFTKGEREDNNVVWFLEKETFTASGKNAVKKFEKQESAKVLGTWGQERSFNAAGVIEFLPSPEFKGKSIAVGIGCYEWSMPKGNPYQHTINRFTKNILDYLSGKEIAKQ